MFSVNNDAETLFFYAKLPMIGLGMILGLFVFLCAKDLYGLLAASIAVFVYCLDPNILAHSQVVHTDIVFATFYFISCYFFWRTLHHLSWTNLSLTCVAFGLASIAKYSFVTMVPVWGALGLCSVLMLESSQCAVFGSRRVSGRWERIALFLGIMACAFCGAYVCIWGAYGFRFDAIPGRNQSLLFASSSSIDGKCSCQLLRIFYSSASTAARGMVIWTTLSLQ